jgi:hypothetical protein
MPGFAACYTHVGKLGLPAGSLELPAATCKEFENLRPYLSLKIGKRREIYVELCQWFCSGKTSM